MSVLNVHFAEMASGASTPTLASPTRNRASFMGSSGADWSPETETAVNTPFHLVPACSAQDLKRLREKALEDDFENDLDHAGSFELERLEQSACRLERLSSGRSGEGHGAADIIVVDWLPGDPEVSARCGRELRHGFARQAVGLTAEPLQLAAASQIRDDLSLVLHHLLRGGKHWRDVDHG